MHTSISSTSASWVIDLGATYHMKSIQSELRSYMPLGLVLSKVHVVDGYTPRLWAEVKLMFFLIYHCFLCKMSHNLHVIWC